MHAMQGAAPPTPEGQPGVLATEPFHDAEVDMDGMEDADAATGSGSKRQKLKEGLSSLFGKGSKKEQ